MFPTKSIASIASIATSLLVSVSTSFADLNDPMLQVNVKSYESLTADAGQFATALGQGDVNVELQLASMIGTDLMALVNKEAPWHLAVWFESMVQPPVIAVVLPVADFEAFETAVQTSPLGQMGAQYLDLGDSVVLFGNPAGAPVADTWTGKVESYVEALEIAANDTFELSLTLNDQLRAAIVSSIALPKAQMLATFDDPDMPSTGVPADVMKRMMNAYFSMYESMLKDLDTLDWGMSIVGADWRSSFTFTPLAGSGTAKFLSDQNVDITDLGSLPAWDSDFAMVMGIGALPEELQPGLKEFIEALMPLYGLSEDAATDWLETMNMTLPCKSAYSMNFDDGLAYSGFYEVLGETPATEVYEKSIALFESLASGDGAAPSYYSDVHVERGYRSHAGHSVDLVTMTMNPEHPLLQLPEQQKMMEELLGGGELSYEITVVGDRVYLGTKGGLDAAMAPADNVSPIEINENTRMAGSINIISMMKMGAAFAGPDAAFDLSEVDAVGTQYRFSIETGKSFVMKSVLPLKLFQVFSEM